MAENKRLKLPEIRISTVSVFCRASSCNNVAVAIREEQRQRIENYTVDNLKSLSTVFFSFNYRSKSSFKKNLFFNTCELLERTQIVIKLN